MAHVTKGLFGLPEWSLAWSKHLLHVSASSPVGNIACFGVAWSIPHPAPGPAAPVIPKETRL